MKKWKYLCLIFILMIIIASFNIMKEEIEVSSPGTSVTFLLEELHYQKDGIDAYYPHFVSGALKEKMNLWNEIIDKDFQKILGYYAFDPFPELEPEPINSTPIILNIKYDIKTISDRLVSIYYAAAYSSKYSAHPSELIYTTNLDLQNDRRLRLNDIVKVDETFVQNFRKWDFKTFEEGNEELNQAISGYFDEFRSEDLLMGFQAADIIGSDNLWGMYSYLTPDSLGISISVPHVLGDHVEFEQKLSELQDFLLPDFTALTKN